MSSVPPTSSSNPIPFGGLTPAQPQGLLATPSVSLAEHRARVARSLQVVSVVLAIVTLVLAITMLAGALSGGMPASLLIGGWCALCALCVATFATKLVSIQLFVSSDRVRLASDRPELNTIREQNRALREALNAMQEESAELTQRLQADLARAQRQSQVLQAIQEFVQGLSMGPHAPGPSAGHAGASGGGRLNPEALSCLEELRRSASGCIRLEELQDRLRAIFSRPSAVAPEPIPVARRQDLAPVERAEHRPASATAQARRLALEDLAWRGSALQNGAEELAVATEGLHQELQAQERLSDRVEAELNEILSALGLSENLRNLLVFDELRVAPR
jgi:hypothetical protein